MDKRPWLKALETRRQARMTAAAALLADSLATKIDDTVARSAKRGVLENLAHAILEGESNQGDVREMLAAAERWGHVSEATARAVRAWLD